MSLRTDSLTLADEVVIPGSVANLGGGFDTLGVAVQLYLRARIVDVRDDGGARLEVASSSPPVRGQNALERGYASIARRTGRRAPTVRVEVASDIPMAAGLGSSAAATVAGVRIFERVTGSLPESMLLGAAAAVEGHADNAAPALLGGFTSVVEIEGADPVALQWPWPGDLQIVVASPHAGLATAKARAALADVVARRDAVFNLQRVLALVHALQRGEYAMVREAVKDRWHQPARAALVPLLTEALEVDDPAVLGVFLSGAGPSIAAIVAGDGVPAAQMFARLYERAGMAATVRTLAVHQPHQTRDVAASAHGRTIV